MLIAALAIPALTLLAILIAWRLRVRREAEAGVALLAELTSRHGTCRDLVIRIRRAGQRIDEETAHAALRKLFGAGAVVSAGVDWPYGRIYALPVTAQPGYRAAEVIDFIEGLPEDLSLHEIVERVRKHRNVVLSWVHGDEFVRFQVEPGTCSYDARPKGRRPHPPHRLIG